MILRHSGGPRLQSSVLEAQWARAPDDFSSRHFGVAAFPRATVYHRSVGKNAHAQGICLLGLVFDDLWSQAVAFRSLSAMWLMPNGADKSD